MVEPTCGGDTTCYVTLKAESDSIKLKTCAQDTRLILPSLLSPFQRALECLERTKSQTTIDPKSGSSQEHMQSGTLPFTPIRLSHDTPELHGGWRVIYLPCITHACGSFIRCPQLSLLQAQLSCELPSCIRSV